MINKLYEKNVPKQRNLLFKYVGNVLKCSDQSQRRIAEVVEQAQREELISEISELIQNQLVTSALGGPIRDVLERQMRVSELI